MGGAEWMARDVPGIEEEAWRCQECSGTGTVRGREFASANGYETYFTAPCPRCDGTGWLVEIEVAG